MPSYGMMSYDVAKSKIVFICQRAEISPQLQWPIYSPPPHRDGTYVGIWLQRADYIAMYRLSCGYQTIFLNRN
jgi:hypothetical protein